MKSFQIHSRMKMMNLLSGSFQSAFHGRGIEFEDFREYSYGDDAARIDWLASSKNQDLLVRRYREETLAHILGCIDIRESLWYNPQSKIDLIRHIVSLLYYATSRNGDMFGGMHIGKNTQPYFTPRKSPISLKQLSQIDTTDANNVERNLDISPLLSQNIPRSIAFVITDSLHIDTESFLAASMKHDLIVIYISSEFEDTLSGEGIGYFCSEDTASFFDAGNKKLKEKYITQRQEEKQVFQEKLRSMGIDILNIADNDDVILKFIEMMQQRNFRN